VHHIVLDFGTQFFPLLEGQSIGIVPPGSTRRARRTTRACTRWRARAAASARATTTPSLTVKRVVDRP
jgi:benzoyl-CoA 2,3-dioxygenase component A